MAQTVITAGLLKPAKASAGVDEAGERQRRQHQQRHEVHANDLGDKKYQRNGQDAQDQCDFEGHSVNL